MVRRAASSKLGDLAAAISERSNDKSIIKNEVIPLFKTLAKDDQDSVRLQTIGACVEIAKLLDQADIDSEVSILLFSSLKKRFFFDFIQG